MRGGALFWPGHEKFVKAFSEVFTLSKESNLRTDQIFELREDLIHTDLEDEKEMKFLAWMQIQGD